jgi:predicted kinase
MRGSPNREKNMTKIALISGNVGAGKSTYATRLSVQDNGYIFTTDEWMRNLFYKDIPDPPSYEWALERTERIEVQILQESLKLLARNISVILDIGFFAESQRTRVQSFFRDRGYGPVLHYLDVDKETRWQRVDERNTIQGETFEFFVSRQVFEFCETIFEPLDEEERRGAVIVTG